MATWITSEGDMVDAVCEAHYGLRPGAVEAVLEANPGLADRGPELPAGIAIELPELPAASAATDDVKLWS